jgi:hypothetical protein
VNRVGLLKPCAAAIRASEPVRSGRSISVHAWSSRALLQCPHRGRAAEAAEHDLPRTNAASGGIGDFRDGQRHASIGTHELFGRAHIARCGSRFLPLQILAVVVRQAEQQ